mmetsp:Transcript_54332/g.62243  ORF Transcript_54332/g.62243 Transcript_54332/m.62243 type:complete len:379 (+) Transcript_54332:1471-2607(+)
MEIWRIFLFAAIFMVTIGLMCILTLVNLECYTFVHGSIVVDTKENEDLQSPRGCPALDGTKHYSFPNLQLGLFIEFQSIEGVNLTFIYTDQEGKEQSQKADETNLLPTTEFDLLSSSIGKEPYFAFTVSDNCISERLNQQTKVFNTAFRERFSNVWVSCRKFEVNQHFNFTLPEVQSVYIDIETISPTIYNSTPKFTWREDGEHRSAEYNFLAKKNIRVNSPEFNFTYIVDTVSLDSTYAFTMNPDPCNRWIDAPSDISVPSKETILIESLHPYCSGVDISQEYQFPKARGGLKVVVDPQSELRYDSDEEKDFVAISYEGPEGEQTKAFYGTSFESSFVIPGSKFTFRQFTNWWPTKHYGYKFSVTPIDCFEMAADDL